MTQARRVLIAEDEAIIRMDLREMLEEEGFIVVAEASDGRRAVELAREHAPDLAMVGDQDLSFPPNVAFRGPRRLLLERTTA